MNPETLQKLARYVSLTAIVLVIIGAFSWGLIGIFNFNIVTKISSLVHWAMLEKIIYILVGLSAVWVTYDILAARSEDM